MITLPRFFKNNEIYTKEVVKVDMCPEEYLINRVDHQIKLYSKNSKSNKTWLKSIKIVELIAAALIPLIAGMSSGILYDKWIVGLLGVTVSILAAITSINRFQENWISYRTTAESLKHEKYLFLTKSGSYGDEYSFENFVQRIEALISKENSTWAFSNKKQTKKQEQL